MKHSKRIPALALALALVLSLLPAMAWAEKVPDRGGGGGGAVWNSAFERENSVLGWQMIDADNDVPSAGPLTPQPGTGTWSRISRTGRTSGASRARTTI